jgi:hypothetical protein
VPGFDPISELASGGLSLSSTAESRAATDAYFSTSFGSAFNVGGLANPLAAAMPLVALVVVGLVAVNFLGRN